MLTADGPPDEEEKPKPKSSSVVILKNLFLMYHYLYSRPPEDADDYRIAVAMIQTRRQAKASPVRKLLSRF